MRIWRRVGLQGRLALALASVAVVAVALATVLANAGLHSSLDQFAREQLKTATARNAQLAAALYRAQGHWTTASAAQLVQQAEMNGYRLALTDAAGAAIGPAGDVPPPRASARITVDGRVVGTVTVAAAEGAEEAAEDRSLHDRLNRQHLLAGALALALGLLVAAAMAPALARPLRRITDEARMMGRGELQTRVTPSGAPELRELGQALNRLAETLEHEERIRRNAAADIAHELRTPLSGIVSRIEAAQDGVLADEPANLEAMHTEDLRLTRLVEDLGKLAEAQQPGLTLRKELLDEFASPWGCESSADASSSVAEFTAPAARTKPAARHRGQPVTVLGHEMVDAPAGAVGDDPPDPYASEQPHVPGGHRRVDPAGLRVALGTDLARKSIAGRAHRMQVPPARRSTPMAFALGLAPCSLRRAASCATYGSCGRAGYGNGVLRRGSVGSSPVVPWTRHICSAWP